MTAAVVELYNPNITPPVGRLPAVPKINVYLPDDLADAVRQAHVPVSAVCQQALEEAVRRVTAVAEATSSRGGAAFAGRGPFTGRLRRALTLARNEAMGRGHAWVGTEHLLLGMLGEARNLGVAVLEALEVDLDELRVTVDSLIEESVEETAGEEQAGEEQEAALPLPERRPRRRELRLTPRAESVLRMSQTEALKLGHNYVGCEHVLLGLVSETEGIAGRALRVMGAELTAVRNEVQRQLSAVVLGGRGRMHHRGARRWRELDPDESTRDHEGASFLEAKLDEVLRRLEAVERRLGGESGGEA
ncbi:MAG TPA: Clp protease N-terminal domain-containing protein [Acidimicrobiales bacterium]|nr:Clp protease N-terminal domain-containing protein [Acidimicrobiales bacterium]